MILSELKQKLYEQLKKCQARDIDIDECYSCEYCDDPYCCTIPDFIEKVLKWIDT